MLRIGALIQLDFYLGTGKLRYNFNVYVSVCHYYNALIIRIFRM